jgi:Transposase DDE domain
VDRGLTALPPAAGELEAIALDGKTLRGRRTQGAPAVHLLSALSHRLGLTMWQQAVADKTTAIPVLADVLRGLLLEGRVITVDAWRTPRAIAHQVVEAGGDDVRLVKGNQPPWQHDIRLVCHEPGARTDTITTCSLVDHGHGRLEERRLTPRPALVGSSDWPGLAQVFQVERRVTAKKSGVQREEVVSGVTSLSPERAGPEGGLRLGRQHWQIEHKLPGVRDVTFDEDRSQVRCGSIPQLMAMFRNTAIGFIHRAGATNSAAACRRFAAQPWSAFALLGIRPDN